MPGDDNTTAHDQEAQMELDGVIMDENGQAHNIYDRDEKRPENDVLQLNRLG